MLCYRREKMVIDALKNGTKQRLFVHNQQENTCNRICFQRSEYYFPPKWLKNSLYQRICQASNWNYCQRRVIYCSGSQVHVPDQVFKQDSVEAGEVRVDLDLCRHIQRIGNR